MKKIQYLFPLLALLLILSPACKKKDIPEPFVKGCTDENSLNYNPLANTDDGTCEYPDVYLPRKAGNSWYLSDVIMIPVVNIEVKVNASFVQYGDTTINGVDYVLQSETVGTDFGNLQAGTYGYRQATDGKVYRIAIGDSTETLFMDYPLSLGKEYYSTPEQNGLFYKVVSFNSDLTVPAGTFQSVLGIEITDLTSSIPTTQYFSKNVGPIRIDIDISVSGFDFSIKAGLDSLHLMP